MFGHFDLDTISRGSFEQLFDLGFTGWRCRRRLIIERCAYPDFQPALLDYVERSEANARAGHAGMHTPHLLDESLSWHSRFEKTGSMRMAEAAQPS